MQAKELMESHNVKNPAIVIDASHDNCCIAGKKTLERQIQVVHEVVSNLHDFPELRKIVKGFMLESFIKDGNQSVDPNNPDALDMEGLSITDPCLGWEKTEKLCAFARVILLHSNVAVSGRVRARSAAPICWL
mgnify:CR=1 FL=1